MDLFQVMINRMKDRGQSAVAASRVKEQMEAKVSEVTEENNMLKGQLEASCQKIQKQASQLEACKSRMESWKSRVAKLRDLLNEIGYDFQNLHGEAIKLKRTKKELLTERNGIAASIQETREQLAKAATYTEQRRGELSEMESGNELLRKSLKDAEERAEHLSKQLSDEKNRSRLLEVYIQTCSKPQSTKLDKIMSHQHEMKGGFDAALFNLGQQHVASIKALQESLSCDLSGCLAVLQELREGTSSAKADNDDDCRVRKSEAEATKLRDELKSVEAKVRAELSRASIICRDRERAKHDQKVHELKREKSEVQSNLDKVSTQLTQAQLALTECEDKMKKRVDELELMVGSKEKENESLRSYIAEKTSKLESEKWEAAQQPYGTAQNTNIVPFASIREQPRVDSPDFANDEDELAALLMLTSEEKVSNWIESTSKSDEAQATRTANVVVQEETLRPMSTADMIANGAFTTARDAMPPPDSQPPKDKSAVEKTGGIEEKTTKPKAVTFDVESAGLKRKLSAGSQRLMEPLEDKPVRVTRRTYARTHQHLPSNELIEGARIYNTRSSTRGRQTVSIPNLRDRIPAPPKYVYGTRNGICLSRGSDMKRPTRARGRQSAKSEPPHPK
ncbi:hypothetical protein ASPBRDRAFT_25712 [Aspergillus brasiliensis CBS 101740]|uniref:Uncharacterized protein n=1 Tax=Aspergillus brasiliensis (strain CBS 101740 / IMI 381727 / IBT 21946) TaxID=767769 RepID=A0A1L9V2C3_ASPBC|nr:hypothetical protein ASPBRDRAFT_25712 [Aspergillus brasiliensis CBS 101740]